MKRTPTRRPASAGRLEARLRELECHHAVARVIEEAGGEVSPVLAAAAEALAGATAFPHDARVRIRLRGREQAPRGWTDTPWCVGAPIEVHGHTSGSVEVAYARRHSLTPGEVALVSSVAQRLGRFAERLDGERRLEAQDAELRKRLLHLTRVTTVGEMASSIAHEVNQPLTAIATYAQAGRRMVAGGAASHDDLSRLMGRITDEALRAGEIVHRLKELVRRRESERRSWSVNALILQVAPLARVDARLHGVDLRLELGADLPPICADGVQIQQVVLNLVRNAVDSMEDVASGERVVEVRTWAPNPGEVQVSVSDEGCGMPEAAEEDLYQPFFTTKQDGMGMGLSISRSIVLLHRGRLWFESNRPHGTIFHFTLPAGESADDA